MSNRHPPVSFYFTVTILGLGAGTDTSFSEVQGLGMERPMLEVKEGGENRFTHRLPERAKFGNLILKRGVLLPVSGLAVWCKAMLESDLDHPDLPGDLLDTPILTQDVIVSLLTADGLPLMFWHFVNAWPVKWEVSNLSADKNELAIETIELAYQYFTKLPGPGALIPS